MHWAMFRTDFDRDNQPWEQSLQMSSWRNIIDECETTATQSWPILQDALTKSYLASFLFSTERTESPDKQYECTAKPFGKPGTTLRPRMAFWTLFTHTRTNPPSMEMVKAPVIHPVSGIRKAQCWYSSFIKRHEVQIFTKTRTSIAMTAFADDTTIHGNSLHNNKSSTELARDVQTDLTAWNKLLHAAGHLLELSKCACYFIMWWDFDSDGHPTAISTKDLGVNIQIRQCDDCSLISITQLSIPETTHNGQRWTCNLILQVWKTMLMQWKNRNHGENYSPQ
jgi:hypothetical protein